MPGDTEPDPLRGIAGELYQSCAGVPRGECLVQDQVDAADEPPPHQGGVRLSWVSPMQSGQGAKIHAAALATVAPDEAEAYKKWVLQIGEKVALAAKEHGVTFSDPEKTAPGEIAVAPGLQAERSD